MAKLILVLIVLLVIGLFVFNYMQSGELTLIPKKQTENDVKMKALEDELRAAKQQLAQAGRSAGISGLDTSEDAHAAKKEIDRITKEIAELKKKMESE